MAEAGSRAVVIGGASGIGWAVAQGFAAEGHQVTVADRNADGTIEKTRELGAPHDAAHVDVTDEASVAALFEQTGPVDVVVNTAGFGGFGRQVAALELASRGIRVNAVSPGFVHTPLTELVTMAPGVIEDYTENTPLGRLGVLEDVAEAVLFLCSDKASWLTGEILDLNGGAHLKRYPDVLAHVDRMAAT